MNQGKDGGRKQKFYTDIKRSMQAVERGIREVPLEVVGVGVRVRKMTRAKHRKRSGKRVVESQEGS